jgi:hypothetical protein
MAAPTLTLESKVLWVTGREERGSKTQRMKNFRKSHSTPLLSMDTSSVSRGPLSELGLED